ncbi:ATP-binding protein [Kitasatospora sp. HPMI-4]|uniref:ATP-binding protein n=1 Tax=Kitasatospora sp. HPMI-4 TaxID=3448443 RepID=UPI003F1B1A22
MNAETTHLPGPAVAAAARHFTVLLSGTRRGARLARRFAVQQLTDWGEPYETAEQIVAELASNAAVHGRLPGRSFRLTLSLDPGVTLHIAVTDPRPELLPEPGDFGVLTGEDAESGRGLLIVAALADRWGVDLTVSPVKTVWAELDLGAR